MPNIRLYSRIIFHFAETWRTRAPKTINNTAPTPTMATKIPVMVPKALTYPASSTHGTIPKRKPNATCGWRQLGSDAEEGRRRHTNVFESIHQQKHITVDGQCTVTNICHCNRRSLKTFLLTHFTSASATESTYSCQSHRYEPVSKEQRDPGQGILYAVTKQHASRRREQERYS
jgi:hypothetical protein